MIEQAKMKLRQVFGYEDFRGLQQQAVESLLLGQNTLVVMPTGGGKSLCYQLPSLVREGCGVVVSPLIALMEDQVTALSQWGIRAGCLNSSVPWEVLQQTERQLAAGELDLVYIAPERLVQPRTLNLLERSKVALFAIDEAHCINQWGHDFRPEYLQLIQLASLFPDVPRIALTATADERSRNEIVTRLGLGDHCVRLVSGFDRPNICYRIGQKNRAREQLLRFIRQEHSNDSGIVYCLSRKRVEEVAAWLVSQGFNALPYHAGLSLEMRKGYQHRFLAEEQVIMVATIAFGMGIDKPNVRFVAHLDLPRSIEAYYQETGRAGRDGAPATAWMVYGLQDVIFLRQMLASSGAAAEFKRVEQQKLEALLGFCEITSCRRHALLRYFGESPEGQCGNCDCCLEPAPLWDATEAARKALSAVYRTGQRYGVNAVIDVLLAKEDQRSRDLANHQLSVWGIGTDLSRQEWRSVFRQLVARGLLGVDPEGFGVLHLSESCRAVLRGEETLMLRQDQRQLKPVKRNAGYQPQLAADDYALWEALKQLRRTLADEQDVPPYVIFHDATLMEMVQFRPQSPEQLRRLNGVGEKKLTLYGDAFLELLTNETEPQDQSLQADEALILFRAGMSATQVGRQLKLSEQAVYQLMSAKILKGEADLAEVVEIPLAELDRIQQQMLAFEAEKGRSLQPIHDQYQGRYTMGLLRCIRAELTRERA